MSKVTPYVFIAVGIILTVLGIVLLNKKRLIYRSTLVKESPGTAGAYSPAPEPAFTKTDIEISKEKGDTFEKYVVSRLDKQNFDLLEWQGDKYYNGAYPRRNLNPDIVVALRNKKVQIALECKWRSKFYHDKIEWASSEQLQRYREYEGKYRVPVFIVIGIGGEPIKPEEVYVVPLSRMKFAFAAKEYLQKFKHVEIERNFFYDQSERIIR
jgi:hypothetical protein